MAKIAWLGEPEGDDDGPKRTTMAGITFPRGEEVDVDNEHVIAKAKRNPYFKVDGVAYVPDGKQAHPNAGEAANAPGPIRRDKMELSELNVAELREEAGRRNINVDGLSKVEIREKLQSEQDRVS